MITNTRRRLRSERGAALVIAIFSLMLISIVATSLILTAGTQSAIKSNYKSAMHAFYDAKAGLEEARGRLWPSPSNPNPISNCVFPGGGNMPVGRVCYITNPSAGEAVDPTNLDPANPYADFEYKQEWRKLVTSDVVQPFINSTSFVASSSIAGPLYKWVRITPRTEASANLDSDGDGTMENTPLFFDGQNVNPAAGSQILTITSLAVTPYGSRRMVQYTVAAGSLASAMPTFPSALTLDGNGVTFTGSGKSGFFINGNDMDAPSGTQSGIGAIGFTNSNDSSSSNVSAGAVPASNYLSPTSVTPIGPVSVATLLQTPSSLEALVQNLTQSADKVINGPVTQSDANNVMPAGMSATNPMITVVNGDLTINGWHNTGYGLLLVTGTLTYDPDASWNGIVLVIGKGQFVSTQTGTGQINGVLLIAQTRDPSSGKLLSTLGPASFKQTGGGNGIHYSSKWVGATQALTPYQVLSFREIAQTTP
jgi:type II secretory pathway pseudopilin PulG